MLDDVICSCSRSPDLSILFYDEMSSVVFRGTLDPALLRHLCEEATSKFQDVYLIESTDSLPVDLGLPLELVYGLDNVEEGSVAVNLLPLVTRQVLSVVIHWWVWLMRLATPLFQRTSKHCLLGTVGDKRRKESSSLIVQRYHLLRKQ